MTEILVKKIGFKQEVWQGVGRELLSVEHWQLKPLLPIVDQLKFGVINLPQLEIADNI